MTDEELIRELRADLRAVRSYHVGMVRVFSGRSPAVRTHLIPLGHLIQVLEKRMDAHSPAPQAWTNPEGGDEAQCPHCKSLLTVTADGLALAELPPIKGASMTWKEEQP